MSTKLLWRRADCQVHCTQIQSWRMNSDICRMYYPADQAKNKIMTLVLITDLAIHKVYLLANCRSWCYTPYYFLCWKSALRSPQLASSGRAGVKDMGRHNFHSASTSLLGKHLKVAWGTYKADIPLSLCPSLIIPAEQCTTLFIQKGLTGWKNWWESLM